jgi:hypothetical protein
MMKSTSQPPESSPAPPGSQPITAAVRTPTLLTQSINRAGAQSRRALYRPINHAQATKSMAKF